MALLSGARTGLLTTVALSSEFDSRLVEAGGTLVNLAAGLLLWIALRSIKPASPHLRYCLLIACAFNLFTGTGYFFFSGLTNFDDWTAVISGSPTSSCGEFCWWERERLHTMLPCS